MWERICWWALRQWYKAVVPIAKRRGKTVLKLSVKYNMKTGWLIVHTNRWSPPMQMNPGPIGDRLFVTFGPPGRRPTYLVMIPTEYEPEFEWWQKVKAFEWEKKDD